MDAAHQRQTEPGAAADGGACSFVGVLSSLLPPRQQLGVTRDKRRCGDQAAAGDSSPFWLAPVQIRAPATITTRSGSASGRSIGAHPIDAKFPATRGSDSATLTPLLSYSSGYVNKAASREAMCSLPTTA